MALHSQLAHKKWHLPCIDLIVSPVTPSEPGNHINIVRHWSTASTTSAPKESVQVGHQGLPQSDLRDLFCDYLRMNDFYSVLTSEPAPSSVCVLVLHMQLSQVQVNLALLIWFPKITLWSCELECFSRPLLGSCIDIENCVMYFLVLVLPQKTNSCLVLFENIFLNFLDFPWKFTFCSLDTNERYFMASLCVDLRLLTNHKCHKIWK
jgi:hypothetical protein